MEGGDYSGSCFSSCLDPIVAPRLVGEKVGTVARVAAHVRGIVGWAVEDLDVA